jgi:acyl carrier protein
MNMTKDEVYQLIENEVAIFAKDNQIEIDLSEGRKTRLYGASIDSMELVALVVHIEDILEKKTNKTLVLANEKAMSQRTSPFTSIGLLADYVFDLLQQEKQ